MTSEVSHLRMDSTKQKNCMFLKDKKVMIK